MGVHKHTTEQFLERSKKKHGNKYDYSNTVYSGSYQKVNIRCPKHGIFSLLPSNHLQGNGCPKCGHESRVEFSRYTNEEFIKRARNRLGNRYDYSKVQYTNLDTKVEIVCPIHGSFWQIPKSHFKGKGCKQCAYENNTYTHKEFLEHSKKLHGDRYDYTKTSYTRQKQRVTITCRTHGDFLQRPYKHMMGSGCPKCSHIPITKSTQTFIDEARKVHGRRYDYSHTVYEQNKKNVTIICFKHGEFSQRPTSHLNGNGCPKCSASVGENLVRVFLEQRGIPYKTQKTFPDCKYKNCLRYDFYLYSYNLLIEIDGPQHFPDGVGKILLGYNGHLVTQQEYELTKIKDEIKTRYAANKQIELLRIPHRTFEDKKNIIPILTKRLNSSSPTDNPWFG